MAKSSKKVSSSRSFLQRISHPSSLPLGKGNLDELFRVYEDLEKNLKSLKANAARNAQSSIQNINLHKLIAQLAKSKRRIERKIGNTILLEKQHLKKRIRGIAARFQD